MTNQSLVKDIVNFNFNNTKIKNNKKLTDENFNRISKFFINDEYYSIIQLGNFENNTYYCSFDTLGFNKFEKN